MTPGPGVEPGQRQALPPLHHPCSPKGMFLVINSVGKSLSVTIQMKATEQYFPVVLYILLYEMVLTFESVDEILKCDHSNESY